jgi:hypothetical protein
MVFESIESRYQCVLLKAKIVASRAELLLAIAKAESILEELSAESPGGRHAVADLLSGLKTYDSAVLEVCQVIADAIGAEPEERPEPTRRRKHRYLAHPWKRP